jgi:hypothetical protein
VIEALLLAFGKHVGDEAVADVVREVVENPTGFLPPASCQGETFEADHGVAAPVGEPMVAGDENGALAPPLILLVILLTSNRQVMGSSVNSPLLRVTGWCTFAFMTAATLAMFAA